MKDKKPFLADILTGLGLTALVVWLNWELDLPMTQRLSDGCFVAAVMLLGIGGIQFAGSKGTFDMMGFGIRSVFYTCIPSAAPMGEEKEDFLAYKEKKDQHRKSPKHLLLAGLVYLILAIVFLLAYAAFN